MTSEAGQYVGGKWVGTPQGARVISIEPMIVIEFSKYGAFARKRWPAGKIEDIPVEDAMKEFDRLAASNFGDR